MVDLTNNFKFVSATFNEEECGNGLFASHKPRLVNQTMLDKASSTNRFRRRNTESPDKEDRLDNASVQLENTSSNVKTEFKDFKDSVSIQTKINLKKEPNETLSPKSTGEVLTNTITESTEEFLSKNPVIFYQYCGLSNLSMFHALLEYIKDDMKELREVSKFEQLFSVLTKLHTNEENLYLNKYIFSTAYVHIVELFYNKLGVLRRNICDIGFPELFNNMFDSDHKVIIINVINVPIRAAPININKVSKTVNYVIGFTAFGDVFFVSKRLPHGIGISRMLHICGLLEMLQKDYWILYIQDHRYCVIQVGKLILGQYRFRAHENVRSVTKNVFTYTKHVTQRLVEHFLVLQSSIPDFMLHNANKEVCFLDKLVFSCCMILNMLPRCANK